MQRIIQLVTGTLCCLILIPGSEAQQRGKRRPGPRKVSQTQPATKPPVATTDGQVTSPPNAKMKLTEQVFGKGLRFCITAAIFEPPDSVILTVLSNPNIQNDKAIKGAIALRKVRASGMAMETYGAIISPNPEPQKITEKNSWWADSEFPIMRVHIIGIFSGTMSDVSYPLTVSNLVEFKRENGKWTVSTLNTDSR